MYQVIIVIHVLLGVGVIGLVLMQQGKGADAGAAFGTGSAGSVFGAQGAASFLSRSTAILATLFFATSLGLAVVNGHKSAAPDLMTTPANDSGLPVIEGVKTPDATPPVAEPAMPIVPPSAGQQPVDNSAVKVDTAVETPKALEEAKPAEEKKPTEEVKPVEEKKPAEAEQKKPVVKEEHKASKDKKADTHKGKDAKKDH